MKITFLYLLLLALPACSFSDNNNSTPIHTKESWHKLYDEMQLNNIINHTAFEQAIIGYNTIEGHNKGILTLIDFTKPSTKERLYVLDIKNKKLLISSHVAHGRNSGENYATSFSNQTGSYKSSLGFYLTEGTYEGKNGYSLVLDGLEKGINDKAKSRAIVIHGADYADPSICSMGRLGRSYGCPALPRAVNKSIINIIKNGSLVYIYANDENYSNMSSVLSAKEDSSISYLDSCF